MIVSFILSLLFGVVFALTAPLRLLPEANLPEELTEAIQSIGGYLTPVSTLLPVTTILAILGLYLTIESSIFIFKIIMWVIKRLPTQS